VIWRRIIRPLLPWLGRLVALVLGLLALGYTAGLLLIARGEPEPGGVLPPGVAGRLVSAGGHLVHVVEAGDGPPVVLVHGFAGSTLDWEGPVMSGLARTHRVVALDLLGMGFSARGDDLEYGWPLWSTQVGAVMDALGIARASVVGHSLGGAVATVFAATHADRIDKLVLVSPLVPLERSERTWFFRLAEIPGVGEMMLGTADHLPALPGFGEAYHARAHEIFQIRGTRAALLRYLRHGRDPEQLALSYRSVGAPTLIVHGTADDVVPYKALRRSVTAIEGALVLPLEGAGHWIVRDAPDRLLAALGNFLDGAPST
jgi:pimeloyl-ACP methyl ester carboxylesterase